MSDSLTLWNGLYDAGWQSCSTLDSTLKAIHNLSVHEEAVARSLGMMIRTQSSFEHGQGWNVSHFVKAVNIKVYIVYEKEDNFCLLIKMSFIE